VNVFTRWQHESRQRLAERVGAASYGTVLVLAALPAIGISDVGSGVGWELMTGVAVATYVAHAYAEVVGDHVRHGSALDRRQVAHALRDGVPILLAAVVPALVLGLGALGVLADDVALWLAVAVAVLQLVALGAFVGWTVASRSWQRWSYGVAAGVIGLVVVALKLSLSH
jgi:hypothetical protein